MVEEKTETTEEIEARLKATRAEIAALEAQKKGPAPASTWKQSLVKQLTSRKLILPIVAGFCLWLQARIGVNLDPEVVYSVVALIGSFVVGEALVDSKRANGATATAVSWQVRLKQKLGSQKLLIPVVFSLLLCIQDIVGLKLDSELVYSTVALGVSVVFGKTLVDMQKVSNGKNKKSPNGGTPPNG